jgi:adenosylcobinamide-GDP ribazoletransferase
MVPALFHGKSARKDGLGRVFIENTGRDELLIASATTAILMIAVFISGSGLSFNAFLVIKVLVLLAGVYILSFALSRFFQKKFGGLTGDNLGAVSEMSEIFFLSVLLGSG